MSGNYSNYPSSTPLEPNQTHTQDLNRVIPENRVPMENDIALVIAQTDCTREVVITALINQNNDIVDAIMQLTP